MSNCVSCIRPADPTRSVSKLAPWQVLEPYTRADLNRRRAEFWAQPRDPGTKPEIWLVLQAACQVLNYSSERAPSTAQAVLDYAGIRREFSDMRICYDRRGVEYFLPEFLHSEPTNLIEN